MKTQADKTTPNMVTVKRYELAHKRWLNAVARNDVQAQRTARDAEYALAQQFREAEWRALHAIRGCY